MSASNDTLRIVPQRTLQEHYHAGRTDFYCGVINPPRLEGQARIVHTARDATDAYAQLCVEAQRYCDGWFDMRDMQRMAAQAMEK